MADGEPFRFEDPIYVVCEGPADVRLVRRLLERENLTGFSLNFAKGYQNFGKHVRGLRASSDWRRVKRLLIIGDNDNHPATQWRNAHSALTEEGLPAPETPGRIVDGTRDRPSTGIFMVPSAHSVGTLETLLVEAILQGREGLDDCLQRLDTCPVTDCDEWDAVKRAKMQFQTAVAVTCRDDPSAGAAHIWSKTHNPVPVDSPVFDELAEFLRRAAVIQPE